MIDGYKEKLVEMLTYFDLICERNNLRYYATGGTFKASVELVKELGGEIVQGIVVYDVGLNKEKKMYSLFKGADL